VQDVEPIAIGTGIPWDQIVFQTAKGSWLVEWVGGMYTVALDVFQQRRFALNDAMVIYLLML
jgi:hypothetical protein